MADGSCKRLSQDDMDESEARYIDPNSPETGISLTFLSEDKCNDTDFYTLSVDIKCDKDVQTPLMRISSQSVQKNLCHPKVYLESPAGNSFFAYQFRLH